MTTQPAINEDKVNEFVGRFVGDLGAVVHAATVLIGDKLGLYKAMADGKPISARELAERTGTDERYMQEWLSAQAASGYVEYDPTTERFQLPAEQAFALTNEYNPLFVPGGLQVAASTIKDAGILAEAIRTGKSVGWHEHHHDLYEGTERFFRPNYIGNLVSAWIPALEGVEHKLQIGAKVADVGCGYGASAILLAQKYPNSTFVGFDYHEPSIAAARKAASETGVTDRCSFEVASAKQYPGAEEYDLVAFFDCLHDMGDPVGVAAHVLETLKPDGTWMIVEPYASDRLEDNLNSVGRVFYSASTLLCVPASKDQEVGLALGAQAGEARIREVITAGGFRHFQRAAETAFNLVFEARP
ncbi:MAG: methyltransferase domain-containing protein [Rubrobacter sp.]|nr:methyltransferase domain-containing protein [Rubrobacter sp.]